MGIIRYLPVSGWFRASLSCAWTGLWAWLSPWALDRIMSLIDQPVNHYQLRIPFDFTQWGPEVVKIDDWSYISYDTVSNNIFVLILLFLGFLALVFAAVGIGRLFQKRKSKFHEFRASRSSSEANVP